MLSDCATVFDVLAILCSMLSKEEERESASRWEVSGEKEIKRYIKKYKAILEIIINSNQKEYKFNAEEIAKINRALGEIQKGQKEFSDEIYLLAVEVEKRIDVYSNWQRKGMIYRLMPLNANYMETGISLYPYFPPLWDTSKSERKRGLNLNARFKHYIMLRNEDARPFSIIMHYWNDKGFLQIEKHGWSLRVALTPVWDSAVLNTIDIDSETGKEIQVEGVINESELGKRILDIFDKIFENEFSLIIFPEALGNPDLIDAIQYRMRLHPERCTFVALPTYSCGKRNTLVVLGPGGVEILRKDKGTAFIMNTGNALKKEALDYTNEMHILITQELGNVLFPICAELLEPTYYRVMDEAAHVDTIICPSFSPGINSFDFTLVKGIASMKLGVWANTCSAKKISRNGKMGDTQGIIQLPVKTRNDEYTHEIKRECGEICSDNICYFDVTIKYINGSFSMKSKHIRYA